MDIHIRIAGLLWVVVGILLGVQSIKEILVPNQFENIIISETIILLFAVLAAVGGLSLVFKKPYGRALLKIIVTLTLLYSFAWFFLGGVEDASDYTPIIVFLTALAVYPFVVNKFQSKVT